MKSTGKNAMTFTMTNMYNDKYNYKYNDKYNYKYYEKDNFASNKQAGQLQ